MGWAEGLTGLGAYLGGNGPQYQYAHAQEEALLDERRQQAMIDDLTQAYVMTESGNIGGVQSLLQNRLDNIGKLKGDPYHTAELLRMAQDPARHEELRSELGSFVNAGIMSGRIKVPKGAGGTEGAKQTSVFKNGAILQALSDTNIQLTTPDGQIVRPGDQGWAEAISTATNSGIQYAGQEAGAVANAREGAETGAAFGQAMRAAMGDLYGRSGQGGGPSEAEIAAQIQQAKDEAASKVKAETKQVLNNSQYDMYSIARDNLRNAIGVPLSGPIVGFVPALTAAQQKLDTAKTLLLPVIKNMMRTAGEGSQDQREFKAMLDLIPDRTTHPEVAASNLDTLDRMVRTKLGVPLDDAGGPKVGDIIEAGGKKYRIVGGDPNDPDVEEVR